MIVVRFLTFIYIKNHVGRGEFTLRVLQIPQRDGSLLNNDENFVLISA